MDVHRRDLLKAAALAPAAAALGQLSPAPSASAMPGAAVGAGAGVQATGTLELPVIPRAAWGARRPRRRRMERHVPVRLTLHHTDVRMTRQRPSPAELRGIQAWHLDAKGHDDIDYHFLVDRQGLVFEGRDVRFRGDTATEYDPTGHFLVCCLGDYEGDPAAPQQPTRASLRSIVLLYAWASQRWQIPARRLGGHRDYAATSCPGDALYALVRDGTLRHRIAAVTRASTVELAYLPLPQAKRLCDRLDERA